MRQSTRLHLPSSNRVPRKNCCVAYEINEHSDTSPHVSGIVKIKQLWPFDYEGENKYADWRKQPRHPVRQRWFWFLHFIPLLPHSRRMHSIECILQSVRFGSIADRPLWLESGRRSPDQHPDERAAFRVRAAAIHSHARCVSTHLSHLADKTVSPRRQSGGPARTNRYAQRLAAAAICEGSPSHMSSRINSSPETDAVPERSRLAGR